MKLNPEADFTKILESLESECCILHFEDHHHDDIEGFYDESGSVPSPSSKMFEEFRKSFNEYCSRIISVFGTPKIKTYDWDLGIPTFASSGFYAQWNVDGDAICLFVNADNPGDPTFLIFGKCREKDIDYTPGAEDPWNGEWWKVYNNSLS